MDEQTTDAAGPAAPDEKVPPRLWLGLAAMALAAMMLGVDAMVVTVANPTISAELGATLTQLQWVTTGYMLAYAALLVAAGKVGDRYGHRKVFLAGIIGFVVSSVLVGLSHNIEALIAWRVLQGMCGATLMPSALAILRLTFPPSKIKIAIGVFIGTFALSSAGGPFFGGLVVEYAGWRWAFFINVIGGAVTLLLASTLIRAVPPADAKRGLDVPGIALVAVSLATLVYGISEVPVAGWTGFVPLACFVVSAALIVLLVLRERTTTEPLLPPRLFRSRTFVAGNLILLVSSGLMFSVWFYLSLFLQNVQGSGPLDTGLRLLPIPAAGIVVAPLSGLLNQKFGPKLPLALGLLLCVVSLFGLSRVGVDDGYASIWPFLVTLGMSMSLVVPVGTEAVVSSAPKRLAGVASGVGETMDSLGPALGVASLGTALSVIVQGDWNERLEAARLPADTLAQARDDVQSVAQGVAPGGLGETVARIAHETYTSGLHTVLLGSVVVVLVFIPLILLIKPTDPEAEDAADAAEAAEGTTATAGEAAR
jgi:EmrB/QacA subfamily drug resistance transporter